MQICYIRVNVWLSHEHLKICCSCTCSSLKWPYLSFQCWYNVINVHMYHKHMYTKVNLSMHNKGSYACMQLLYLAPMFRFLAEISSAMYVCMKFVVHGTQSSDDVLYIQSWFIMKKLCMVNIYYDDKGVVLRMQLHMYGELVTVQVQ